MRDALGGDILRNFHYFTTGMIDTGDLQITIASLVLF